MVDNEVYIELVKKAQSGDRDSLDRLTEIARKRLCTYVHRMTLRHDLTQDIVQESMLEMFRFLDKLEKADRFWPWLRRIAVNKLHHHYSRQKTHKMASISDVDHSIPEENSKEGFADLVASELRDIVVETMGQLKPRYREILVMRCYEEMEYSQIAEEMGGSEFSSRVLFYRAKNALARQLSKRGLGKGALLGALVIFGKLTAPSKAAAANITVSSAMTKVGIGAASVALATSKAAVVTLTTAGIIAAGSVVVDVGPGKTLVEGPEYSVSSPKIHHQGKYDTENLYFYPDGASGPVIMRQTEYMPGEGKSIYRQWLQDDKANYLYDTTRNQVIIRNSRMWNSDLTVKRLPTDRSGLSDYLSKIQPGNYTIPYAENSDAGLFVKQDITSSGIESEEDNILHGLKEDYFKANWLKGVQVVDERDALHRQKWAYFEISGNIGREKVTGAGRIPFVYEAKDNHFPWIRLQVGDRLLIEDGPDGTFIYDAQKSVKTVYVRGAFFKGLLRPWMGLHTVDTVRRDAAERQIAFKSRFAEDNSYSEVEIYDAGITLVYGIDMARDVIDKIDLNFKDDEGSSMAGTLEFKYVADADLSIGQFMRPRPGRLIKADQYPGMKWIFQLTR